MDLIEDTGGSIDPNLARWLGYSLSAAGFALGMLDLVKPSLPALGALLGVAFAVLMVALQSPESFEVQVRRGSGRAFNFLLGGPVFGLFLPSISHALADPYWPLIPAAIGAAVGVAFAWNVKDRPKLVSPLAVLLFMAIYGPGLTYGAVVSADVQFDSSTGAEIPVEVLGKYESHGKSTTYHLQLPAWGPKPKPNTVGVPYATYQALQVGDPACIVLHPGALTLAWFTVGSCRQAPSAT